MTSIVRSFSYRLLPTKQQHRALERILEDQRQLYNAALEYRIAAYRKAGLTPSLFSMMKDLTRCRAEVPGMNELPAVLQRGTMYRLHAAYAGFFRGKGFPRFRGKGWFDSFSFPEFAGLAFDGARIRFKGLPGGLKVHLHRPMPDTKPLGCKFIRDEKGWKISFQHRVAPVSLPFAGSSVGLDLGLSSFAALSDGETVPAPQFARKAQKRMRVLQRAMARCKSGSRNRGKAKGRIARTAAYVRNARQTFHRQLASKLVREHDLIAIENLNIKGLSRTRLARSVHDAGWGSFVRCLKDAAERACRQVVGVDPRHTSQTCPECGQIKAKALSERVHRCECGYVADRDVAAARVILSRAVAGPGVLNLGVA